MPLPVASLPELDRGGVRLRPSADRDAVAVLEVLQYPSVAAWWGTHTLETAAGELRGAWIIEVDGHVAGLLEAHEEADPDYACVAFDIALAPAVRGRGLGRKALRLAIDYFVRRGHHRFTIDPAADNAAAIRAYAAVGFRSVGILRSFERSPGGTWRDGLLMDLLAAELADAPS